MIYKERLEKIYKELEERRLDLEEELTSLPEGELLITVQGGDSRYYQRIPAKGNKKKERRYGIKRKPEILNGLVRKKYINRAIATIDRDLYVAKTALDKYISCDEASVMKDFIADYPELSDYIFRNKIDEEAWVNRFHRVENYHSESLEQTNAKGIKMRSKNEVYIASRLDHYNQIYRSDCPTGIPGLYRIPDFTILRKQDNKIIYWEHMGMMDDIEYRIDNKRKLEEYEAAGIVPWDNLILTYDTVKGGLRANLIEAMIQAWLL